MRPATTSPTHQPELRSTAVGTRPAVLYARVSSKDQEKEGYSIPAQLRLLRDQAQARGLTIMMEFVDVETAKTSGRQEFTAMLAYLKRHHATCRTILVEKTDRLYRNPKDSVTIADLDVELHLVKENVIISKDSRSSDKFIHDIRLAMAKHYIDNLSEEASKGMLEKARSGVWPSSAPLGYHNTTGPDGKRIITPDPDRAPHVTTLFRRYATSEYSIKSLARAATSDGLRSRSGRPVGIPTIHAVLRNPLYTGTFRWKGQNYQGTHEPLIDTPTWEHVQDALDHRHEGRQRRVKHDFTYTGMVTCGHCGCSLVGEKKKGRYTYYHCTGYRGHCPEPYVREETLHEEFLNALRRISLPTELLDWLTQELRLTHDEEQRERNEAARHLQAQADRIKDRIDAMYLDKLDRRITNEFFDEKAKEWRAEQERLRSRLLALQDQDQDEIGETILQLDLAHQAATLFPKQPPQEQRALLRTIMERASWKNGTLTVTYRAPFDALSNLTTIDPSTGKGVDWPSRQEWPARADSNRRPTA